jgi:hypothetical protein
MENGENIHMELHENVLSCEENTPIPISIPTTASPEIVNSTIVITSVPQIPKFIFIVPYRNRASYLKKFLIKMSHILEDIPSEDYKICVIHQSDGRSFNRGAIKNIGFLYVKYTYPNDYKNITLVFNDVDTILMEKNSINYITTKGIVKHFLGFTYTLGGIVSILGEDFEKTMGFPNFWAWGFEDNMFQSRVLRSNLKIDRSIFYNYEETPISENNPFFLNINSGNSRVVSKSEYLRYINKTNEGYHSIRGIQHNVTENVIPENIVIQTKEERTEPVRFTMKNGKPIDNGDDILQNDPNIKVSFTVVNITQFFTPFPDRNDKFFYNLKNGAVPFKILTNINRPPGMFMVM